ncbi:MAG TPA: alpha/beta fold hydrolase [Anaerolineae bacterium]|nr:alpha/beta fold hydrolase [Anaerolineae bacterium]
MQKIIGKLGIVRIIVIAIAVLFIAGSWWMATQLYNGLTVRRFEQDGVPLTFLAPEGGMEVPGVIVAHGFGGSQQLMLGYGLSLARAGYGVMLLNFSGHASNPASLSMSRDSLQDDMDTAYAAIVAQPEIIRDKIALLGHSMGSGAVMNAGIADPDRYVAVIAVSPTGADVSATTPPNLLLQAGELEGRFVENAERLLADAGGENDAFAEGRARGLEIIPGVEHILILFSADSRDSAALWLSSTFGDERALDYRDTRMAWLGLHQLGWLILVLAAAPLIMMKRAPAHPQPKALRRWLGFLLAPFVATGALALLSGWEGFSTFLGLHVGGALAIWILVMGVIWLVVSARPRAPRWQNLLWGGLLFALIWVALGLISQYTWMQWFLIPARLWRWPILALACIPWMLAMGHEFQRMRGWGKAGFWLLQSVLAVAALLMVGMWVPGMYVVVLFAPVLPIIVGIELLISKPFDDPWTFAVGNALFFGWLIATFFPLA